MRFRVLMAMVGAVALAATACDDSGTSAPADAAGDDAGAVDAADSTPTPSGDPVWTDDVQPLLTAYCKGCHGGTACTTGICWLDDYATVQGDAFNDGACGTMTRAQCILARIDDGSMPPQGCIPGGPGCITVEEAARVQAWVDDGSPE